MLYFNKVEMSTIVPHIYEHVHTLSFRIHITTKSKNIDLGKVSVYHQPVGTSITRLTSYIGREMKISPCIDKIFTGQYQ